MKKILYFSDSKFPLAGLAGAMHTGRLPLDREPESSELWSLPFLNLKKRWEGKVVSLGEDGQGNKIYALSVKGELGMVHRLVESFLRMYKIPESELDLVDSGVRDNGYLLAGGLLCRFNFTAPLGRYLAARGVKKTYDGLTQLVADVKTGLANLP